MSFNDPGHWLKGWLSRGPAIVLSVLAVVWAVDTAAAAPRLVFDVRTGAVLYAEDADDPWYPASVTKLMTTYVALSAVRAGRLKKSDLLVATNNAAAQPPSKIGIARGQTITLENALRLLIVKSANDVAVVVAEGVSGSVEAFAAEMNATAARLGMKDSNFVNPHGLPDARQITTARDIALMARALATEFPESTRLTRLPFVKIGDQVIRSHNALIGRYGGADGMKTGFICASGFNIVATATRRSRRVAAVVFGAHNPDERRIAAERLLDLGFATPRRALAEQPTLRTLPRSGDADAPVNLRPVVCGEKRAPRSDVPGLRAFSYSGPVVSVVFGPRREVIPLPPPRPERAQTNTDDTAVLASQTADDKAPEQTAEPSIPLPASRPSAPG